MTATYHPSEELLVEYAAGSLSEPLSLLVATHLALCPACRGDVDRLEAVGGTLIEDLDPVALDAEDLDDVLARLDSEPDTDLSARPAVEAGDPRLPQPLRGYVAGRLEDLPWRVHGGFLSEVELLPKAADCSVRLMRIKGGVAMPRHTHEGRELTLVLSGGFRDEGRLYERGDVAEADASVDHRPVAEPGEDCLCLAVFDGSIKLTGAFGRFLNPFIRF